MLELYVRNIWKNIVLRMSINCGIIVYESVQGNK